MMDFGVIVPQRWRLVPASALDALLQYSFPDFCLLVETPEAAILSSYDNCHHTKLLVAMKK